MPDVAAEKYLLKEVRSSVRRKLLGEILVEKEIVTRLTIERLLALGKRSGKRVGHLLEELGIVTGDELAEALAQQFGIRVVRGFAGLAFHPSLLNAVPVETAVEHSVFPLKVENGVLGLAMFDPTNERIVGNIESNTGLRVVRFISTRKEIGMAISRHYLGREYQESRRNTILVVDDDQTMTALISGILTADGYEVETAADGMEAFREIVSRKPHLIITDKEMPKLDGYALLHSLKSVPELKLLPVMLLTSSTNPEEEAQAYEKGFYDFISKPIRDVTLRAKVKRALSRNPLHELP
jgi:CheY-like chemotaxis protein